MAVLYSIVIIFNLTGTPTAVLRLFDRFQLFAVQQVIASSMKLIGISLAFLSDAGLMAFLLIWMLSDILGYLLLLFIGWRELRVAGFHNTMRSRARGIAGQHVGLWGFVFTTNLSGSLKVISRELDTLIVGSFLGLAAAGLYKVAKQFSRILARLVDPLYYAVFPELARLWAKSEIKHFRTLIIRSGVAAGSLGGLVWLSFFAFGDVILRGTVGPQYVEAKGVLVWYMLAILVSVVSLPLQPAMLAMGRPQISVSIFIITTLIYFPLLVLSIKAMGLIGPAISYLFWCLLWAACMGSYEWYLLRNEGCTAHAV